MVKSERRLSVAKKLFLATSVLLALLMTPYTWAQTDSGTVKGSVTDTQGAVVSGATVTVTNVGTLRAIDVTTGADGSYVVPVLPPGNYRVDVKQSGFKSASRNFTLETSQVAVLNFQMEVGQVTETLEVTGDAPVVDTSTSSSGEVIQGRQVTELPLNGRNFTQLALLTPGVTRGVSGDNASGGSGQSASETFRNSETGGAALSVNGLRPQANNFLLDGVDNNDSLVNTIIFFPPAEAIQEFRVNTSVAPAEFGRAGGAIVQTTIKPGTNDFHGSAFEFIRNSFFDARPTNLQVNNPKQAPFKRNQFGFTFGGPFWKNKLFFFVDYQGLRQSQPLPPELATVPTDLMRQGNFSELLGTTLTSVPSCAAPGGPLGAIYDPRTCTPFPGNIIDPTIANKAGLNYLNAYPQPNLPGKILQNYQAVRQSIRNFDDFDGRLDYNLSSKDLLFGRFSYGQDKFNLTPRLPTLPSGFGSGLNYNDPRSVAAGYTHTFTANLLNDFRFAYVRDKYGYFPPFGNIPVSANLGIVNANRTPLLGGGALIGGSNNELEYTGDGGPYTVPQKTYQYLDSVSLIHGAHAFKFGANIIHRELDFFQGNDAKGYFVIGGLGYPGTGRYTGYEVSELLAGFVDYELGSSQSLYQTINWETGYYAQDDWRVNRRLTLNLGVRYDLYTHPYELHNQQSNYDFASGKLLVAGVNGNSRSLVDTDFHNFGPRLGFAYDLFGTGRTSIRGGFGIFYFLDRGGVGNQLSNNPDFNGIASYTAGNGYRITLSGQGPSGNNDWTLATAPLPPPTVTVDPNNPQNVSVISIPKNSKTSNVREWNVQLEQELTQNMSLDIGYVGTQMNNLVTYYNANNPPFDSTTKLNPTLGGNIVTGIANGTGYYNGLQTRLNQRFKQGWQFTGAYTWSHTTDNSNGAFSVQCSGGGGCGRIFVAPGGAPLLSLNRGNADNDIRHFFTFSSLYELPFGRGRRFMGNASRALDLVAGGWQFNTILTMTTGTPLDINANGSFFSNRPDLVGPVVINGPNHQWINPSAFALPPENAALSNQWVRVGDLGRNSFYGPGTHTVDLSLFKDFTITERVKTQFRAEAFNAFNSPQWANPDTTLQDGTFGQITGPRLNTERQLQFALRVTF